MNAIAALALATLAFGPFSGVTGSGKVVQQTRSVGDFHAVSVGSGIHATVTLGERASLVLEGDDNILARLRVEVKEGMLVLEGNWENLRPTQPIRARIVATRLDSAEASGGAEVTAVATSGEMFEAESSGGAHLEVRNISSARLSVNVSGGATARLSGKAKEMEAAVSGGAELHAYELPVEAAKFESSGGSRIEAWVRGTLSVEASGGASIHLKGRPASKQVEASGGAEVVVNE